MSEKPVRGRPETFEADLTTLGGRIRAARKKAKKTLKQAAAAAHIKHPSLIEIEKNESNPSERTLVFLAEFLEADFGEGWLREHLKKKKRERRGGQSEAAELIKKAAELGELKNIRTYLELSDYTREVTAGLFTTLTGVDVPEDKTLKLVPELVDKKAS